MPCAIVTFSIPKEVLEKVDEKRSYRTRSAWLLQAAELKLKADEQIDAPRGVQYVEPERVGSI